MSKTTDERPLPRSMRHKQILDAAAENPDASLTELASEVPSATTDLVKRVLEKHGDPASENTDATESSPENETEDQTAVTDQIDETELSAETNTEEKPDVGDEPTQQSDTDETPVGRSGDDQTGTSQSGGQPPTEGSTSETDQDEYPSLEELTETQRTTLQEIARSPDATQRELAAALGVSAPTISNRVNSIEGFDWKDRQAFVESVFDIDSLGTQEQRMSSTETELHTKVEEIGERLSAIEQQLEGSAAETSAKTVFGDAELTHKIVHACIEAETISKEEELRLLEELLQ